MEATPLKKPLIASVADYLTKGFKGKSPVETSESSGKNSGVLYNSNLEKALQATNHLLDAGKEGNEDLVKTLEDFGLEMSENIKLDQKLFIQTLTSFQSQLEDLKGSTESYIKETLLPSDNVTSEDKDGIIQNFNDSTNIKDFSDFRTSTKIFKNDSDFLIKTLSALRNGLEEAEADLAPEDFAKLTTLIDEQSNLFYETGTVNNAVIQNILDKTMSLVDESNNRLVKIDSEDKVQEVIKSRVETKVDQLSRERVHEIVNQTLKQNNLEKSEIATSFVSGEVSTNELLTTLKEEGLMSESDLDSLTAAIDKALTRETATKELTTSLETDLAPLFATLSQDARTQIELQKQAHLDGLISAAELRATLEDRLTANGELTSEQTGLLSLMETRLSHIDENTEQGKLSSADLIRNSNSNDAAEQTSDQLQALLDGIHTGDNATVRSSMFAGARGAEDLGEKGMDSILDSFGGSDVVDADYGERQNRRRSQRAARPQRRGIRGLIDKGADKGRDLFDKGRSASKGGLGKLLKVGGAATAVGMGAYDMFNAEDTQTRKDAAGSTTGALVGGALGSLLGPLGTLAGGYIGSEIGSWMAKSDWFSDPEDSIPDRIKDLGPQAELDYIGSTLLPEMHNSLVSQSGVYEEEDIEDLKEYALSLRSKIKESKEELTPASQQIFNLRNQGATPEMISMFTKMPIDDINTILSTTGMTESQNTTRMAQTSNPDKVFDNSNKTASNTNEPVTHKTVVHKTEDNRTYITKSNSSRRDVMRDQLRSSF
jgi:hypothetical protein